MAKKKAHLKRPVSRTRSKPRRAAAVKKLPVATLKAIIAAMPEVAANEFNAGLVIDPKTGAPTHWLIDVDGEAEVTHKEGVDRAPAGLDLPTRREQSLLMANAGHRFQKRYYWSKEEYAGYSDYAWFQYFGDGYQYGAVKDNRYLARFVRRVAI